MLDRVLTRGQFAGDGLGSAAASFECCRLVGSPDVLNMAPTLAHFYPKYPIRTSGMAAVIDWDSGGGYLRLPQRVSRRLQAILV